MPVMHRDSSAPTPAPAPTGPQSLEHLLRDSATFTETENAPEGLAYRALSRQIAAQDARERRLPTSAGRKSRVALWLGGLSAGTIAGASAAVLLMAHVSGNGFPVTPEALPTPILTASANESGSLRTTPVNRPKSAVAETEKSALKSAVARTADFVPVHPIAGTGERARPEQTAKGRRGTAGPQAAHRPRETRRPESPDTTEPATAQWKTETINETAYQLDTTAYVAEAEIGSDSNSTGDKTVTALPGAYQFRTLDITGPPPARVKGFSVSSNMAQAPQMRIYRWQSQKRTFTCPRCHNSISIVQQPEEVKCSKCHRDFEDNWQVCPFDGTERPERKDAWRYCPICGKSIKMETSWSEPAPYPDYSGLAFPSAFETRTFSFPSTAGQSLPGLWDNEGEAYFRPVPAESEGNLAAPSAVVTPEP